MILDGVAQAFSLFAISLGQALITQSSEHLLL